MILENPNLKSDGLGSVPCSNGIGGLRIQDQWQPDNTGWQMWSVWAAVQC